MALRHRGLNDIIGGSAQPQITLQGMATVNLPVPLRSIRQKYDVFTRSFFEQIWTLTDQNERLAATRDLLLPRLISGELSVAAAERELEVAA
jgi:type I restriction enzyme S subunit